MEFSAEAVRRHLPAGHKPPVYYYEELGSTNIEARRLAREGAPHGTAVLAERQTAGRGRLGRSFFSPGGAGVYLSMVLRPGLSAADTALVTPAAAVATARAISRAAGVEVGVKWVNDLYYAGKKLCGILAEAPLGADGRPEFVVIGIGVNVLDASFPPELSGVATSLEAAGAGETDRAALAAAIIAEMLALCGGLGERTFLAEYRARSCVLDRTVTLVRGEERREAYAVGIDDDARLLVRMPDGSSEAIGAGEISLRGDFA